MSAPLDSDVRLILLDEADNVFVVAKPIAAGEMILIGGKSIKVDRSAGLGFKIARNDIAHDASIVKYGVQIGLASEPIALGSLVHTHNVISAYLPSTEQVAPDKEILS